MSFQGHIWPPPPPNFKSLRLASVLWVFEIKRSTAQRDHCSPPCGAGRLITLIPCQAGGGDGVQMRDDTMCQSDAFTPKLILQDKKKEKSIHLKCYYLNHLKMGACMTDSFWKISHVLKTNDRPFSHAVFPTCPHEKSVLSSSSVKCINMSLLNTLPSHRRPHPTLPPSSVAPAQPRWQAICQVNGFIAITWPHYSPIRTSTLVTFAQPFTPSAWNWLLTNHHSHKSAQQGLMWAELMAFYETQW